MVGLYTRYRVRVGSIWLYIALKVQVANNDIVTPNLYYNY